MLCLLVYLGLEWLRAIDRPRRQFIYPPKIQPKKKTQLEIAKTPIMPYNHNPVIAYSHYSLTGLPTKDRKNYLDVENYDGLDPDYVDNNPYGV